MTIGSEITREHVEAQMREVGMGPDDVLARPAEYARAITGSHSTTAATKRIKAIARVMMKEAQKYRAGDSTRRYKVLERHNMRDGSEVVLCDRGEGTPERFAVWTRNLVLGCTHGGNYFDHLYEAAVCLMEKAGRAK